MLGERYILSVVTINSLFLCWRDPLIASFIYECNTDLLVKEVWCKHNFVKASRILEQNHYIIELWYDLLVGRCWLLIFKFHFCFLMKMKLEFHLDLSS